MINSKFRKWIILTIVLVFLVFLTTFLLNKQSSITTKNPFKSSVGIKDNQVFLGTPSIEKIFSADHSWVATLSAKNIKTIVFTGDVIPARSVNSQALRNKNFNWPYLKTADLTRNADLTVINLESPLIKNCPTTDEGMVFCGDLRNIQGLVFAGVDLVSIANNHFANYGQEKIEETIKSLKENNINTVGVGDMVVKDIKGTKFAFLAYNDIEKNQVGIENVEMEKIKKDITSVKQSSDFVIVIFHWGGEYRDFPDERQKELAHFAVSSGADLIIGNHPHWIQPVEIYKDKVIAYAHGNFVFDQMWSLQTKQGVVGKYTFYNNKLIDIEFTPIQIENYGQPRFIEAKEKEEILKTLWEKSKILSNPR
jgi:poly-gamma-glutamate capsule biosynthesis protein CapA/YwtB (metallophosphatase superfamily)